MKRDLGVGLTDLSFTIRHNCRISTITNTTATATTTAAATTITAVITTAAATVTATATSATIDDCSHARSCRGEPYDMSEKSGMYGHE